MDKQTMGYTAQRNRNDWPAPHWRKWAEAGYLHVLIGRPVREPQRAAAYAILALLDGQPGSSHYRLFRGWWYCASEHIIQENLLGDDLPDFEFLVEAAMDQELDLVIAFRRLYDFLQARGNDCRPVWRRQNNLPWPRTEDVLTVREAADHLNRPVAWLREQIARGLVPAYPVGRYYLLMRGELPT